MNRSLPVYGVAVILVLLGIKCSFDAEALPAHDGITLAHATNIVLAAVFDVGAVIFCTLGWMVSWMSEVSKPKS